jgi:serine/threonine protein kinase
VAPLTSERWRRIESIFHAAIGTPAKDRPDFIRKSCDGDEGLFTELQRMLAAFDGEQQSPTANADAPETTRTGDSLGEYRIDRELGHGGMGTVYLAHRADGQFEQQVAMKVVSPHLRSQFFTERFRTERQILAQLNHPNITRLLDGGIGADGDPYLVMEYVDGFPINRYCDSARLAIPDRIRLFLQVCSAVEYAHRNLIVHRDLKPGNIFVTGEGVPKLLDFGTAKLLMLAGEDATATRFGMMTPRYASPEQLRGEAVTTVTDVYSLGVMLYELLTGAWPFGDPDSLVAGIERAVREVEPARPGSVVTEETAGLRSESKAKLARLLDGDLRSVINMAIEAEPLQRYSSVEQFSEDLRRWLRGQPVLARPQTWLYRGARFAGRNRWRLTAGVLVSAGLGFLAFSALEQHGLNERHMMQVRDLSQSYLTDILNEVGKLPGSVNARLLIVDRARRSLDQLLPDAPRDPDLRRELASAYLKLADIQDKPYSVSLGDAAGALVSYRKAESLTALSDGNDWGSLATLVRARRMICEIEARSGHYPQAVALLQSAIEPARRLWKEAPPGFRVDGRPASELWVEINLTLGYTLLKEAESTNRIENFHPALAQLRRAVALAEEVEKTNPAVHHLVGSTSQYAGFALEGLGNLTGDVKYFQEAVIAHRRTADIGCDVSKQEPNPQTLRNCADALSELSWAFRNAGEGDAAVKAARDALAIMEPILKAEPNSVEAQQDVAEAYFHLGAAENTAGRFRKAIDDFRTAESRIRPPGQIQPNDLLETFKLFMDIRRELAKSLVGIGDARSAANALQEVIAAADGRPTVHSPDLERLRMQLEEVRAGGR